MTTQRVLTRRLFDYLNVLSDRPDGIMARRGILRRPRRLQAWMRRATARREGLLHDSALVVPEMCFYSVTWRCNLECVGCYAAAFEKADELSPAEIERVLSEMVGAGTVLFAIAGGEPLQVPGLLPILSRVRGLFLLFTNATLLTRSDARTIARAGNIVPVISIEGDPAITDGRRGNGVAGSVDAAMSYLRDAGVPFAFSSMVSHANLDLVTSRAWSDAMWERGARFGFLVDYVPIPESYDERLVLTSDDRVRKSERVRELKTGQRPFLVNFPADEYRTGGCLSAGRGFVHLSAAGDLEPCTFCHYSPANLRTVGYLDALRLPFFSRLRDRFASRENPVETCMLLAHDDEVAQIAHESGARKIEMIPAAIRA